MDVVGVYHYYPYGKLIENRTWEAEDARFGFQGQERDDEIAGAGNYIHYKARDYSALTSRMDRIDPLSDKFPSQSPYITSGNNPIYKIDIDGMQDGLPSVLASPTLLGLNERHDDGIHTWGEISNDDEFAATRKAWLYAGAGGLFFAAVEVYGVEAVATFVAEEIAEECFENLTGIPVVIDPFDFAQQGLKKAGKSFVADGTKQLGKRGNLVKGSATAAKGSISVIVHGNSKFSQKAQHGYEIFHNKTGEILEYGISGQKRSANQLSTSGSPRINQKLRIKYGNDPNIDGRVIDDNLGNRKQALEWGQDQVDKFAGQNNGNAPRFQKRPKPKRR